MVRRLEPHLLPGLAPVERLINSVAPRRTLPVIWLAASHPHHRRIRRRDRDVANRRNAFFIEHWLPSRPVIRGLPHAAGRSAHVHNVRIAFDHGEIINASTHHRGTNLAKLQVLEFVRGILRITWCARRAHRCRQHQHHTGKNPPKRPRRLLHLHLLARKVRHLTPVGRLAHQMFLEGPTNPVQTDAPYGPHVSWRPFRVFPCLLSKQLRCAPRLQITATPC